MFCEINNTLSVKITFFAVIKQKLYSSCIVQIFSRYKQFNNNDNKDTLQRLKKRIKFFKIRFKMINDRNIFGVGCVGILGIMVIAVVNLYEDQRTNPPGFDSGFSEIFIFHDNTQNSREGVILIALPTLQNPL